MTRAIIDREYRLAVLQEAARDPQGLWVETVPAMAEPYRMVKDGLLTLAEEYHATDQFYITEAGRAEERRQRVPVEWIAP